MKGKQDGTLVSIGKMFLGCRYCGNAGVWPYGKARELHSCRECYQLDDWSERQAFHNREKEKSPYARIWELEFNRADREYYREKRIKNGVIEPVVKCADCGLKKPLFEFPPQWVNFDKRSVLHDLICYDCRSALKDRKLCPCCLEKMENEDFEDDVHTFKICVSCRKKIAQRERVNKIIHYRIVTDSACTKALECRGIDNSPQNIATIRELLLAKRINKKIKYDLGQERGKEYESNNTNV